MRVAGRCVAVFRFFLDCVLHFAWCTCVLNSANAKLTLAYQILAPNVGPKGQKGPKRQKAEIETFRLGFRSRGVSSCFRSFRCGYGHFDEDGV